MIITILTGPFICIPPHSLGAVEKLWYSIGKNMQEKGHKVTFISRTPPAIDKLQDDFLHSYIKGYNRTGSFAKDLILDFIYSLKALISLKKTDVLVLNSITAPILCRLFKHKYKISVYNVARFPKGQMKYYSNIDRLSCVSFAVQEALLKQTPSAINQVKVIPNPVDTTHFHYQAPFQGKFLVIAYSGRVHPEKGLDILVSAYAILSKKYPQLMLKIIGPREVKDGGGGMEYINKLITLSDGYPIDWVDPIKDASVLSNEISKCNIYCYPSIAEKGETFGVAPLEAMADGRATIVSSLDCFKDFVQDNYNALIFDYHTNAVDNLVEKIELLINDVDLRDTLGTNAANSVKDNFSIETITEKYLDDFQKLLLAKIYG